MNLTWKCVLKVFFSTFFLLLELICLYIMGLLSAHLTNQRIKRITVYRNKCAFNCATPNVCVEYFLAMIQSIFFLFLFFALPHIHWRILLVFAWIVGHEYNQNELKLAWGMLQKNEKKERRKMYSGGGRRRRWTSAAPAAAFNLFQLSKQCEC